MFILLLVCGMYCSISGFCRNFGISHIYLHHKVVFHSVKRSDGRPRRYGSLHAPYMHAFQCHNGAQFKPKIHLTIDSYVIIQYKTE